MEIRDAIFQTDIELIVFLAIMLHKAPAAFGLVTFLMHEGLERVRIRKHLVKNLNYIIFKWPFRFNCVNNFSDDICFVGSCNGGRYFYVIGMEWK